jgi:DNA-binding LytR/AlgR family response regulator
MMTLAICDDDRDYTAELRKQIIGYFGKMQQIDFMNFHSGAALAQSLLVEHKKFDAIFLDVIMPEHDGIKIAKILREKNITIPIIFVSTSRDYIVDGYYVDALAYVVKDDKRLTVEQALDKLMKLRKLSEREFLHVRNDKRSYVIPFSEILTVEKDARKTVITRMKKAKGETIYTNQPISQLAQQISEHSDFTIYYHSSYLNAANIKDFNKKASTVTMKDGSVIFVSRANMNSVMTAYIRRNVGLAT